MALIHKITAVLMLVAWLVVTQHGVFEVAGMISDHGHEAVGTAMAAGEEPSAPHSHDQSHEGWHLAEKSASSSSVQVLKIAAPLLCLVALTVSLFLRTLPCELTLTSVAKVGFERPIAWVPQWHFVRRAAPVSRAPSAVAV